MVKLTVRMAVTRTAVVNKFNELEWRAAAALEKKLHLPFSYLNFSMRVQRRRTLFFCMF